MFLEIIFKDSEPVNKMKIAVCSFVIGDRYKDIVKYGIQTRINYCKKHNYDYIDDDSIYDRSRRIEWSKILIVQK